MPACAALPAALSLYDVEDFVNQIHRQGQRGITRRAMGRLSTESQAQRLGDG